MTKRNSYFVKINFQMGTDSSKLDIVTVSRMYRRSYLVMVEYPNEMDTTKSYVPILD